jgi:hypothetical protein
MPSVFPITVHIHLPSRRYPSGQVAHGYFTFVDHVVAVTDCDGDPVRDEHGKLYTRKLDPGATHADAESAAGFLFKDFRLAVLGNGPPRGFSGGGGSGFGGPLDYPKGGWR